jgi:hypothetical protein
MFCVHKVSTTKNPYITSVKATPTKASTNPVTKTKKQAGAAASTAPAVATSPTSKIPTTKKPTPPAQAAIEAASRATDLAYRIKQKG